MPGTKPKKQKAKRHREDPDPLALDVGKRVKSLRESMKATQKKNTFDLLVEETGLGRGYISELERGLVVPTITSLSKLAAALEVTMADLVIGDSPREQLFALARQLPHRDIEELVQDVRKRAAVTETRGRE